MKKIVSLFFIYTITLVSIFAQILPASLTCEYLTDPVGIEETSPRLAWKLQVQDGMNNIIQKAYQIQVASSLEDLNKNKNLLWNSGKVTSDQSIQVVYKGSPLKSRQRVYWRVKVWDNQGNVSNWSAPAYWEMGLLKNEDWQAKWITTAISFPENTLVPAPIFKKGFNLKKNIKSARMYITAHGIYDAKINGQAISEDRLNPGWTSYQYRLQYQTYDVTPLLKKGENAIAVTIGDGWYRGRVGWSKNWSFYGNHVALLSQLEVTYTDGKKEYLLSDESWQVGEGPVRWSSIYDGEMYDANLYKESLYLNNNPSESWPSSTVIDTFGYDELVGITSQPVRDIQTFNPQKVFTTPKGEKVIDFGQNLVGRIALNASGKKGDTITIYHAEVLDKEGNFYTDNLRTAEQKIVYICKGEGQESYSPTFTFMGFRYIKVEGLSLAAMENAITAIAMHSDMPQTGHFECSNPLINQLQSNIIWGQRGNFVDVPTDCPQRDERMGWTGDAQAFAATACFNFNSAGFFTKWLEDLKADQDPNGSVPFVIPDVLERGGSIGWGDAATIVPWTLYQKYGDKRILEKQYASMASWVGYLDSLAGDDLILDKGFHFGDWLFFIHPTQWNIKPGYTDIDFLGTAFYAHSCDLLARTAEVLNYETDFQLYRQKFQNIKKAFQREFVTPTGRLSPHSQTGYTIALQFNLLEKSQIPTAVEYLVKNIKQRNFHLSTGFLGTPYLCQVLSDHGHEEVAYKLLLQKEYPSWLYPVTRGATTIWERWDGIKPDSTFQNVRMNSFNHYAYGAVGHWMYSELVGIGMEDGVPAYKSIIIKPHLGPGLQYAHASLESMYGLISCKWELEGDQMKLVTTIPPNTTAKIILPLHPEGQVVEVGSGSYEFQYSLAKPIE